MLIYSNLGRKADSLYAGMISEIWGCAGGKSIIIIFYQTIKLFSSDFIKHCARHT
jgi:hypothetical protein